MRHKYDTQGLVLGRNPSGEANASFSLLTEDLGIIRVRAQGVRRSGAKLSAALTTFAESQFMLVKGKDGWRLAGALLKENWFASLPRAARPLVARVNGLLLRLAPEDAPEDALYPVFAGFLWALRTRAEDSYEYLEILAVLGLLRSLGFDEGPLPGGADRFSDEAVATARVSRADLITRVNRGISASGL